MKKKIKRVEPIYLHEAVSGVLLPTGVASKVVGQRTIYEVIE